MATIIDHVINEQVKTLTKEEAVKRCKSITNDDLAAKVLVDKYFLYDGKEYLESTPSQMFDRLALAISKAEVPDKQEFWQHKFRETLDDFKFVPAGRVLYGLGNPFVNITLKNCYVIGIREDSIKGIFQTAYEMAETYKAGGGCGIDISPLRPKGSPVKNAARESSGAVSFMDLFSKVTGTIGQKARIGALMICIDVSHPDIEDFIKIKGGDNLDLVRYANVSVKITDEFMNAVVNDRNFDLRWGGKVYKTIKAKQLWNELIHYAWKRAEPGLLFWDAMCDVPSHHYPGFKTIATNPCLTGDMRLLTSSGYKTVRELWAQGDFQEYNGEPSIEKHGQLDIINSHGIVKATNVYKTSNSECVYEVKLKNGICINATASHDFIIREKPLSNNVRKLQELISNNQNIESYKVDLYNLQYKTTRKKLSELKIGDQLILNQVKTFGDYNNQEYAELAGWVVGDGSVIYTDKGYQNALVRAWDDDIEDVFPKLQQDLLELYKHTKSTNQSPKYTGHIKNSDGFNYVLKEATSLVLGRFLQEDGNIPGAKHKVPNRIWSGNENTVAAFLRGLFSADGSVQVNSKKRCISIRISQINSDLLKQCQSLLGQFCITSTLHKFRRKASKQLMNNGKGGMSLYNKKATHELIISGINNCKIFIDKIGFIQDWKNQIAINWFNGHRGSNNSAIQYYSKIKSIKYVGMEETFCLTEPENHEITINNVLLGQCAETSLSDGDSCNLGSMNLGKYVLRQFDNPEFDYKSFEHDVRIGTRFLDNIISLEKAPILFQQKVNDNGRRLGLGIMGLADMFLKMNIKYDSDKAITLSDKVMSTFMNASYDESCNLAIEKGPFPVFDVDTHFKSKFINRLPDCIQNKIKKTGIRNIAVHAIAPTGSLSCIAQCSSSIEPVFMMKHIRKTNLGTAKKVEEHVVLHPAAKEYQEQIGGELPEHFVEAHQIDPEYRIKLQAHINKFIDQSISNTLNCPNDITEDKIGQYYIDAWKNGCKGITVYREGSREGVLVAIGQKKEPTTVIQRHGAPKRPKKLDAKVHVVKPNGKTYTVFVGLLDGRPYEVFALDHELAGLPDNTTGYIIREKDSSGDSDNVYHFEKGALRVSMLNRYEDQDASLVTRLISTALRHGVPLEFISDQIIKSKVPITSLAKALGRAVAYYIKPDEAKSSFKCPECGSRDLKVEGTCYTCQVCGASRCH